jgi:ribokinase
VIFLAAFGDDDAGRRLENSLTHDRIDLSHCWRIAGVASGVALILVNRQGENQIAVAPGANHRIDSKLLAALPAEVFAGPGVFVSQLETPAESVLAGLKLANSRGLTTILNPAPADSLVASKEWAAHIDVLVVNQTEAAILGGVADVAGPSAAAPVADRLLSLGFKSVVVTFGENGYGVYDGGSPILGEGLHVQAVDAVGAGDTFVGALACALSEGRSLADAAAWANRAAALAVTRAGAQPAIPTRREIDAFSIAD